MPKEIDPEILAARFGEFVLRARTARGLSYRKGAAELDLALSSLQSIEAGRPVDFATAARVADRLGFSIDTVIRSAKRS